MENDILKKIFEEIDSRAEDMTRMLKEMAAIESPSSCKAGIDQVCSYVNSFCENLGMKTHVYEYANAGNSFTAVMNPHSEQKMIALMGHMDTVHPLGAFGSPVVRCEREYIYGPGVYDCKGGLVIALTVCSVLKKFGYKDRPVKLIFSGDEEVGHQKSDGAAVYLEDADKMAAALNCESGLMDGRVAVGRKGGMGIKMIVDGVAAHSGNAPQKGRSAIREAAYKIIEIEKHTNFDGTTFNCGLIQGGRVSNQIPDHCEVTIDVRVRSMEAARQAEDLLRGIAAHTWVEGTKTTLIIPERMCPPMEANEKNLQLFQQYREASRLAGASEPTPFFSGGGSDAAITSGAGVPSLCTLGIRGEDNHALTERALIASLPERARILAALIWNFRDILM